MASKVISRDVQSVYLNNDAIDLALKDSVETQQHLQDWLRVLWQLLVLACYTLTYNALSVYTTKTVTLYTTVQQAMPIDDPLPHTLFILFFTKYFYTCCFLLLS